MKKNIITLFVGIIITMICTLSYGAFDPILKLNIKNLNTKNYVVDLLIDNREKKYEYIGESKPEDKEIFENIQKDYDGWVLSNLYGVFSTIEAPSDELDPFNSDNFIMSSYSRSVYFGQYNGNDKFYHEFYGNDDGDGPGLTDSYKIIIINKDTQEVKISDEIKNVEGQKITIDYNTMKIGEETNNNTQILIISTIGAVIVISGIILIILKKRSK